MSAAVYAETQVVAVVLNDLTGERLAECRHLPLEAFTDTTCRRLWERVLALPDGQPPGMALVGSGLDETELRRISETDFTSLNFAGHVASVFDAWRLRRAKTAALAFSRGQITIEELGKEIGPRDAAPSARLRQLAERRFNPAVTPPAPRVIYRIGDIPICTAGNLSSVAAEAKAGKSAFAGAMLAAPMAAAGADCLSLRAENPKGLALVHFDTEQSASDWHTLLCRAKRRARIEIFPPWLVSYHLTGFAALECRELVELALARAHREFGGIHAAVIDGIGDLVIDPNDAEACFPFVTRLHDLAIKYDTAIINVLHRNPGTEKTRGHLGSQLERKAETNLTLEKAEDGATVVFGLKQRGPSIPKADGPRFRWSDGEGMHVTMETVRDERDRARFGELSQLAAEVFGERRTIKWSELRDGIKSTAKCSDRTADGKLSDMNKLRIITRSPPNLYTLAL